MDKQPTRHLVALFHKLVSDSHDINQRALGSATRGHAPGPAVWPSQQEATRRQSERCIQRRPQMSNRSHLSSLDFTGLRTGQEPGFGIEVVRSWNMLCLTIL